MLSNKFLCAALLLATLSVATPNATAQANLKVMIAGASGTWQNMATGTFKAGSCPTGSSPGCGHYTSSAFNVTDTRPTLPPFNSTAVTDGGSIWMVWDNTTADPSCSTSCNVWAYIKIDSIVGNRCYFAQPHCTVVASPFPAAGQLIGTNIWGADSTPPLPIQALFTTGTPVNVAASEIRPEDALFGQCRINSVLGGGNDGLNGLGLGTNASGSCPAFGATLSKLEGTDLKSGYPGSTSTAHPMAFSIGGRDPFSGNTVPVASSVQVGAVPLIIITNRQGALAGVTDASLQQLQTAFSGKDCRGSVFTGGGAGNINVYSREPLSGTMNTAEYTLFRLPRNSTGSYDLVDGASQEKGLGGKEPVAGVGCTAGGARSQGIGQGELTKFVQNSNTLFGVDGIGYVFFSYGNVSSIADNPNYGYLTVNGIDPIWQLYSPRYDPGQSATPGNLPGTADLPAFCAGNFPCPESKIWAGGQSFPNLRNGSYRQWAMIRMMSDGTALVNVKSLIASAQASAVTTSPDFVPAVATSGDKGLQLFRSHYTQQSQPPNNATDKGGEEGGCLVSNGSIATKLVMRATGCVVGP